MTYSVSLDPTEENITRIEEQIRGIESDEIINTGLPKEMMLEFLRAVRKYLIEQVRV